MVTLWGLILAASGFLKFDTDTEILISQSPRFCLCICCLIKDINWANKKGFMAKCYLHLFFFIPPRSQKTEQPLLLYSLLHFRRQSQVRGPLRQAQRWFYQSLSTVIHNKIRNQEQLSLPRGLKASPSFLGSLQRGSTELVSRPRT